MDSDSEVTYTVFVRDWWHYDARGKLQPCGATDPETLATGLTWAEARAMCDEYNESHDPGPLSRKAEFTRE